VTELQNESASSEPGWSSALTKVMYLPTWVAAAVLAVAILVVYADSLRAPFIFDDVATISSNRSILSLWPPLGTPEQPGPLRPPVPLPTAGRPLVNFSFALNHAISGWSPVGYHIVNVLIHFGSALLLWAIVRRTLRLPYFHARYESHADWLALAIALLWALHPLVTEAVTYTTQRTELMMAFFYLATLYCALRYWSEFPLPSREGPGEGSSRHDLLYLVRATWLSLAVITCLCGMASKEVMVSAPIMVLLFERTFIAGSLTNALRRSWPLYSGLVCTWLLLLALNLNGPRGDSAGFQTDSPLIGWWLTQAQVLLMYLKLVVWPWPLLILYGRPPLESLGEAWIYAIPVLMLGIATLVLLWKNRPIGYLGTSVFAILAPTSIVPIVTEVAAERRMYLPLAAIAVMFVIGIYLLLQKLLQRAEIAYASTSPGIIPLAATVFISLLFALISGTASFSRAREYNEPVSLWREVVNDQPDNFVAHANLGGLLVGEPDGNAEAMQELQTALKLKPDYPAAMLSMGTALVKAGRLPDAISMLNRALALQPNYSAARIQLGVAFTHNGELSKAVDTLQNVVASDPDNFDALINLGVALTETGQPADAVKVFEHAIQVEPDSVDARNNLGRALTNAGRLPEAIETLRDVVNRNPNDPIALNNLGHALRLAGMIPDAVARLKRAVELRPNFAMAQNNLGIALCLDNQIPQGIEHFRLAIKLNPKDADAATNLANILASVGELKEATLLYHSAVALQPSRADFHKTLADLLQQSGQTAQAIDHYRQAVRLQPDFFEAWTKLAKLLAKMDQGKEAVSSAEKAIELARANRQEEAAEQLEEWLRHYQIELRRAAEAAAAASPSNVQGPTKSK
jgi:protein O-mannosyl-transferase